MLTYHDVMNTDLGQLTTAAGKWDDMAAEIKKVEDRYKESVQSITLGPSWAGRSAFTAHTNFAATRYEYSAAQTQAKAIALLLRDAHTDFVRLKKNLESKRAEAVAAGMRVSEAGVVSYDYEKLTDGERNAMRHDPDYAESVRKAVASWSEAIDTCVKAVDDADQGVKIALDGVTVDGLGGKNDQTMGVGFNGQAQGDVEKYEAAHTQEIDQESYFSPVGEARGGTTGAGSCHSCPDTQGGGWRGTPRREPTQARLAVAGAMPCRRPVGSLVT